FERGADLEMREGGVGVLAGAAGGGDQIDLAGVFADAARTDPPIGDAPIAFGAADILGPPIEAAAAIGDNRRTAIVQQAARRLAAADAVDDVADPRDLVQLRRQRLHLRIGVAALGGA